MLARFLIIVGIISILCSFVLYYQRYNPQRLAFAETRLTTDDTNKKTKIPVSLSISRIGLSVPLYLSEIENGTWTDTKIGASYLKSSPIPGEKGNSIIYGHNYPALLGNLEEVTPGDRIEISYSNNTEQTFEVLYTMIVEPDQTEILSQTEDARLTVYTCTGFLDSKRFVVIAFPLT